jgi:hypothetical protein
MKLGGFKFKYEASLITYKINFGIKVLNTSIYVRTYMRTSPNFYPIRKEEILWSDRCYNLVKITKQTNGHSLITFSLPHVANTHGISFNKNDEKMWFEIRGLLGPIS